MLQLFTVHPNTLELLKSIQSLPCSQKTRLVGGTALALQYGHRQSIDLDFFGTLDNDVLAMEEELSSIGQLRIIKNTANIRIYDINGIKVDFVNYDRYEWLEKPILEDGITLASPIDIAAMKINAIEGRGTKKDFLDIYQLLQHYTLTQILDFYCKKYPEHSMFRALMSLSYFEDADSQIPPKTFNMPDWQSVKKFILKEVEAIG